MNDASPRAALDLRALREAAGPPWDVRLYAEAGSTNQLAAADPVPDRVVVADHQQSGRGRLDREWVTPRGAALTFSAVVDPGVGSEWWPVIPLVAGYAVVQALGGDAVLKWPNDVLVGDPATETGRRKVCGILVERASTRPPLAVIGIGINVDQSAAELPVPTATSLALEGRPVDRTELFGDVLGSLSRWLGLFADDPAAFMDHYRGRSDTLGRDVRVDLPGGRSVAGRVSDIDPQGRLLLDSADGVLTLSAGDVVHVRPGE